MGPTHIGSSEHPTALSTEFDSNTRQVYPLERRNLRFGRGWGRLRFSRLCRALVSGRSRVRHCEALLGSNNTVDWLGG